MRLKDWTWLLPRCLAFLSLIKVEVSCWTCFVFWSSSGGFKRRSQKSCTLDSSSNLLHLCGQSTFSQVASWWTSASAPASWRVRSAWTWSETPAPASSIRSPRLVASQRWVAPDPSTPSTPRMHQSSNRSRRMGRWGSTELSVDCRGKVKKGLKGSISGTTWEFAEGYRYSGTHMWLLNGWYTWLNYSTTGNQQYGIFVDPSIYSFFWKVAKNPAIFEPSRISWRPPSPLWWKAWICPVSRCRFGGPRTSSTQTPESQELLAPLTSGSLVNPGSLRFSFNVKGTFRGFHFDFKKDNGPITHY